MSKGMYCSASHWIDSDSSASVIAGSAIFLTMTALPESEAATSLVLMPRLSKARRIASDDGGAVDDGAVDDAVGRNGLAGVGRDLVALPRRLQLDRP